MEVYYPIKRVPDYWKQKLNGLIQNKRLIAPIEVFLEIRKPNDPYPWALGHKRNGRLFVRNFPDKYVAVQKVIKECSGLIDPGRKGAIQADPYLIALVQQMSIVKKQRTLGTSIEKPNYVILTEEVAEGNPHKYKIPDACKKYNIPYYPMRKLLELENWIL